jgi:hypothetical protein
LDGASNWQSKNRTIGGAVKALFKDAVKALLRPDEDAPEQEPHRRRGETEGEFKRLARYLWRRFNARQGFRLRAAIARRYAPIEPQAHAVAADYLTDTLDMLTQLDCGNGCDYADNFDAISRPCSPNL